MVQVKDQAVPWAVLAGAAYLQVVREKSERIMKVVSSGCAHLAVPLQ